MNGIGLGFIGLGQMGGPMAANIARGGFELSVFDQAGTAERAPEGTAAAASVEDVAARADTVFLSLPDGPVSIAVARQIAAAEARRATVVVDLSTIGPAAAREAAEILSAAGLTYIDAPVSGGQAGARAATITVMWAGPGEELERHRDVLLSFCRNPFHVGAAPGQGQALKIINNFLSGTAMAATSEAVLYGLAQGLDMETMLEVINVSTGANSATRDKFPNRIVTGSFDAGFKTKLLAKDIRLYLDDARAAQVSVTLGNAVSDVWTRCDKALPDSDFTRVYQFIRDLGGNSSRGR
ncbi:MAG: NAD(P)-dependent oxidoreductase [Proteobacteria bacterium]|nr:NAD(P)-dependent oxidoreductase [Pseudomonadota bacterium]